MIDINFNICISNLNKHIRGEYNHEEWLYLPVTEEYLNEVIDKILGENRLDTILMKNYNISSDINNIELQVADIDNYEDLFSLNKFAKYIQDLNDLDDVYKINALLYIGKHYKELINNFDILDNCVVYYDCYSMRDVAAEEAEWIFESISDQQIREIVEDFFDYEAYGHRLESVKEREFINLKNGIYVEIF